ncbi:PEP-CTERM sorting domain-containing protein [Prosthecobacter sp.]|jgi:hypothetical protein|uniref:PEP-CTERM sorting domain-containing protein n=1 Tax=Prosthecobacter sp. TaxID=1965333 RepID=UPI0037853289
MRFAASIPGVRSVVAGWLLGACGVAPAATTVFFDGSQSYTLVSSATNADTIESEGYLFTYTMDKLFTGGVGMTVPIGRTSLVSWPAGLHAQAITTGPDTGVGANLTVRRVDGAAFDIHALTFQLWANTAGAGGTMEIMPQLNGEDLYNDPVMFGATGFYSQSFSYADGGGYQGSTSTLRGADTYKMHLYVDWALRSLTVDGPEIPPPVVPEPARASLLLLGMMAVCLRRSRRGSIPLPDMRGC